MLRRKMTKAAMRLGSLALAAGVLMSTGVLSAFAATSNPYAPVEFVEYEGVRFGRATNAYKTTITPNNGDPYEEVYAGMPLFDGQEDHLETYLELLLEEIGPEGWVALAAGSTATGSYEAKDGTEKSYPIPAGSSVGGEALQGAAGQTELSTVMYQAQSWNKDLIHDIGYLMGSENKSKQDNGGYNWTTSTGTSMTDMRLNPLSGRYDEGYGEDPYMASIFANLNSQGYNGYDAGETGLYIMGSVNTKHYSVYNAQWFRPVTSTQVGVRSFYEYNSYSANRGFSDGTISSFMSSYGRINGVPSSASFISDWANYVAKYSIYNGPDAGATTPYLTIEQSGDNTYGQWGNGYDEAYSPNAAYMAAALLAAGHRTSTVKDTVEAVQKGLAGVDYESAYNLAKAYLTIRTRVGIYDEKDANGLSKYYPFNDVAANGSQKADYTSESSQEVALRNAREGIVLLKNEGDVLPLSTDADLGVYGVFANAVNSGIYSVAVTDDYSQRGELAGDSALEALQAKTQGSVDFDMGLNVVTLQVDGSYLYVDAANVESGVLLKSAQDFANAQDKSGYYFGILDSSQGAYSIYSYGAEMWLRAVISDPTINWDSIVGSTSPLFDNSGAWTGKPLVLADVDATFKQSPNQGLPPMLSNYPYHFTMESAGEDGEYYIRAGAKVNGVSFITGVAPLMEKNYGYYLEAQDGMIGLGGASVGDNSNTGAGLTYFDNLTDKSGVTFTVTEVAPAGTPAAKENAGEDDYALIFVGQSYLGLSGEGTDRMTLDLGAGQMEEALNVAEAYQAAGKKTIVVIYANYPVNVEALENSDAVDAILFAGYGGQFGGRALAEVVYGEYAPTGRLVSTWYSDLDLFPELNQYSIPLGNDDLLVVANDKDGTGLGLEDIDDGITVDMTAADVIGTGLTYQYLTQSQVDDHVTYPFGYGLSYADFSFSNLRMPATASADGSFQVTVDVKNESNSVTTSEVVQLYMGKVDSQYGSYVPLKKLTSFEKVELKPGETKAVTLTVDPADMAVWDVNAEDFLVEGGTYQVWVSDSSDFRSQNTLKGTMTINGGALSQLDTSSSVNIWEHAYASENMYYSEYSKLNTAAAAVQDGVHDEIYAVSSKTAGAWTVLSNVDLTDVNYVAMTVGAPEGVSGTIQLRLDSPTGTLVGEVKVPTTGEVTRSMEADSAADAAKIHELGYVKKITQLSEVSGVHDLYLVFGQKDLRAGTIQFAESTEDVDAAQMFLDIEGHWAEAAINQSAVLGIMQGGSDTAFYPNVGVTRGMVMTTLWRLASSPDAVENPFTDIDLDNSSQWYAQAVAWAAENNIAEGYGNGTFGANDPVSREQLSTFMSRYAEYCGNDVSADIELTQFGDYDQVSDWARDAMKWCVEHKIITGRSGNLLAPGAGANRAELATMLVRFVGEL